MPSRQTVRNWECGAVDFLTDIDWQVPIPGFEGEYLFRSKLQRDEALEMLVEISLTIGMPWPDFIEPLAKAWYRRRQRKGRAYGWDNDLDNTDEQKGSTMASTRKTSRTPGLPPSIMRTPGGCGGSHCPRCGAPERRPEGLCKACYRAMGRRVMPKK